MDNSLTINDFEIKGTKVFQKLNVLEQAIRLNSPMLYGKFFYRGENLDSQDAIGSIRYTLCLVYDSLLKTLVPNSLLEKSIRDTIIDSKKIYSIFIKDVSGLLYDRCVYYPNGLNISDLLVSGLISNDILDMLDIEKMVYKRL